MLALLGVAEGDELDLVWKGKKATVCRVIQMAFPSQYLEEKKDEGVIQVCGSDREDLRAEPGDIISVRRRPRFILEKNMDRLIASVLSGVGIVVTAKEFVTVDPTTGLFLIAIISIIMAYLFFYKIRSTVQVTS